MTVAAQVPALRFPEFEGAWEEKSVGALVSELSAGVSVNSGDRPALGAEKGILKTSCVTLGVFDPDENKVVDDQFELVRLKEPVQSGTIIISRMNTPALVGANAIVSEDFPNLFLPDRLWAAKIRETASAGWTAFVLGHQRIRQKLTDRATGTSGSMKNLTKADVLSLPVMVPSLPEQKKIAAFLGVVDAKITALQERRAGLERYKCGLMQALFSQTLRFTKGDGTAFPDWEEKKLSDFLIPNFRAEPKPLNNYLAIGIRSHGKGTFQKPNSDPKKIAMDTLYVVREDDLIVNITFAWEGAIAIVPKQDDGGYVSHRFPTYEFRKDVVCPEYFQIVISDLKFRRKLDLISPGGAGRNRVMSKTDFLKLRHIFPSRAEQTEIADALSAMDDKIAIVARQVVQMQAFKKGLLQQMFL